MAKGQMYYDARKAVHVLDLPKADVTVALADAVHMVSKHGYLDSPRMHQR